MGGMGSGRRSGRRCAEDLLALDVRKLNRAEALKPGKSLRWRWTMGDGDSIATIRLAVEWDRVVLNYSNRSPYHNGGEWEHMDYPIRLDWTPCAFGGHRVWWLCPAIGCGRRAAVLYGGRIFACRQCNNLAYGSQREGDDDRARRRAETIRRKLGWEAGILTDDGGRPKGMHQTTYWRLRAEHNEAMNRALAGFGARLALLNERIGTIK